MALINCPECNKEISDQTDKCPECGFPIKKAEKELHLKKQLRSLLLVVAGTIALFLLVGLAYIIIQDSQIATMNKTLQVYVDTNDFTSLKDSLLKAETSKFSKDRIHDHYLYVLNALSEKIVKELNQDNIDLALMAGSCFVYVADKDFISEAEYESKFTKIDKSFFDAANKAFAAKDYTTALQCASICQDYNVSEIQIGAVTAMLRDCEPIVRSYKKLVEGMDDYVQSFATILMSVFSGNSNLQNSFNAADNSVKAIDETKREFKSYSDEFQNKYPKKFMPEWTYDFYDCTVDLINSGLEYSNGFTGNLSNKDETRKMEEVMLQAQAKFDRFQNSANDLGNYMKENYGG